MLVLTRKELEAVKIGDDVKVTVVQISRGRIKLGIEAPEGVRIWRAELSKEERKEIDKQ